MGTALNVIAMQNVWAAEHQIRRCSDWAICVRDSENVVRALAYGKERGAFAISIVGKGRGRMAGLSDISLVIPSGNYGIVEDMHMFIAHVVSQYMRELCAREVES